MDSNCSSAGENKAATIDQKVEVDQAEERWSYNYLRDHSHAIELMAEALDG